MLPVRDDIGQLHRANSDHHVLPGVDRRLALDLVVAMPVEHDARERMQLRVVAAALGLVQLEVAEPPHVQLGVPVAVLEGIDRPVERQLDLDGLYIRAGPVGNRAGATAATRSGHRQVQLRQLDGRAMRCRLCAKRRDRDTALSFLGASCRRRRRLCDRRRWFRFRGRLRTALGHCTSSRGPFQSKRGLDYLLEQFGGLCRVAARMIVDDRSHSTVRRRPVVRQSEVLCERAEVALVVIAVDDVLHDQAARLAGRIGLPGPKRRQSRGEAVHCALFRHAAGADLQKGIDAAQHVVFEYIDLRIDRHSRRASPETCRALERRERHRSSRRTRCLRPAGPASRKSPRRCASRLHQLCSCRFQVPAELQFVVEVKRRVRNADDGAGILVTPGEPAEARQRHS